MLRSELREILNDEKEASLLSHGVFAQGAFERKVDTLLLTVSSEPKRITGITEVDPSKGLERFERFNDNGFMVEPVHVKTVFTSVDFVMELRKLSEIADNGSYWDTLLLFLLGKVGDLKITRHLALEKLPTDSTESFGPYRNLIGISKTIWGIIYVYEQMKTLSSPLACKKSLKDCVLFFEHNPDRLIKELKELKRIINDELNEDDKVTDPSVVLPSVFNKFETDTLEDFIVFLEELFQDESNALDQTAFEIVNMINNAVEDIDRLLDTLPPHHDSNRHTLKVKRSALMELCIDIEENYKTN